jgi:hypothetical protein
MEEVNLLFQLCWRPSSPSSPLSLTGIDRAVRVRLDAMWMYQYTKKVASGARGANWKT